MTAPSRMSQRNMQRAVMSLMWEQLPHSPWHNLDDETLKGMAAGLRAHPQLNHEPAQMIDQILQDRRLGLLQEPTGPTCSECGVVISPDDGLSFVCWACYPALAYDCNS